jgi:succinate dehydrogenase / fumarate reductase membrane anchor subunit
MSDLRTPLSKVKGLGSARQGVSHWWHQRLTSLLMLPLIFLLAIWVTGLPQLDHASFIAWVGTPLISVCLIFLIGAMFYHAQLGLQVVIEDYVASHGLRTASIVAVGFLCLLFTVIGVISVLRILLGV